MAKEKFYESSGFWCGVGAYYVLEWMFRFYPAFVVGWFGGMCKDNGDEVINGIIAMIVFYIFLWVLRVYHQYFVVLMIYIIFAFPFIGLLIQYWNHLPD